MHHDVYEIAQTPVPPKSSSCPEGGIHQPAMFIGTALRSFDVSVTLDNGDVVFQCCCKKCSLVYWGVELKKKG